MSKSTKYKDKQTGVLVDAWQVPKPFMPTMYKPRWVQSAIDHGAVLAKLSSGPEVNDPATVVFSIHGTLVNAGDWLVRIEDPIQKHGYRVEQWPAVSFPSQFALVAPSFASPDPVEHPMTGLRYEDTTGQFKSVWAWRVFSSALVVNRDIPQWVREAIKSRALYVNLRGEILVVATSTTAMNDDWLVMGEAADLTFGYCVFTDKAFTERFKLLEFRAMKPQSVIHAAVGAVCERLHEYGRACETLSRSIERADGFARELYEALHKHFGGSDAGSTPPRV